MKLVSRKTYTYNNLINVIKLGVEYTPFSIKLILAHLILLLSGVP